MLTGTMGCGEWDPEGMFESVGCECYVSAESSTTTQPMNSNINKLNSREQIAFEDLRLAACQKCGTEALAQTARLSSCFAQSP